MDGNGVGAGGMFDHDDHIIGDGNMAIEIEWWKARVWEEQEIMREAHK
jgi:hypothetical protein